MASKKELHEIFRVSHVPEEVPLEDHRVHVVESNAIEPFDDDLAEGFSGRVGDLSRESDQHVQNRNASEELPIVLGARISKKSPDASRDTGASKRQPHSSERNLRLRENFARLDQILRQLREEAYGNRSVRLATELIIRKCMVSLEECAQHDVTNETIVQIQGQFEALLSNLSDALVDAYGNPFREHERTFRQIRQLVRELV